MRLTDLQIKKLPAPDSGQKTFYDAALPGFGVRVSQGGSKSFVVMYGPKRQLKTLGRYPALSLAEARKAARKMQVEVDALPIFPEEVSQISFTLARKKFLVDSKRRNKERTHRDYTRLLNRHFQYEKTLSEISRRDIVGTLDGLTKTPSERQHAYVAIRTMMNWCEKQGHLDHSPVPRLTFKQSSRSNILSDADLKCVWSRAIEAEIPYGPIVQLLILTGMRRSEVAAIRRSWIDDDLLVLPEGFPKNNREHRLPLSPMVLDVLASVPETGDLYFPARGREERAFNGWGKCKERFDKSLNVERYTLHDLRRTFSSNMARIGTPIHVTERLLNHVSGTVSGVAAIYNRYSYIDEMRAAMEAHDAFLAKLVAD